MRDTELYKQILGLESPWYVSRVELKVAAQRVDIWIEHDFGVHWECPKCSQTFTCRDHAEERSGAIWIRVNFGLFCMLVSHGLIVPNMGYYRSRFPGQNHVLALPFFLNVLLLMLLNNVPLSREPAAFYGLTGRRCGAL